MEFTREAATLTPPDRQVVEQIDQVRRWPRLHHFLQAYARCAHHFLQARARCAHHLPHARAL